MLERNFRVLEKVSWGSKTLFRVLETFCRGLESATMYISKTIYSHAPPPLFVGIQKQVHLKITDATLPIDTIDGIVR